MGRIGADLVALDIGSDRAAANLRLIANIVNKAPPDFFASALCVGPLAKSLKLACPTYCVAKVFKSNEI